MDEPPSIGGQGPAAIHLIELAQAGGTDLPLEGLAPVFLSALFVVLLSALASMTEAAFLALSRLKAEQLTESPRAAERLAARMRLDFAKPLATIVIINNLANIGGSYLTGMLTTAYLEQHFERSAVTTASGICAGLLTFLVILFGEIPPKSFGEKHRLAVTRAASFPIFYLGKVLAPFIWIVGHLQRPFADGPIGHLTSEEEITRLTSLGEEQGAIEARESDMIQRVFALNDLTAEQIMTPRVDVVALEADLSLADAAERLADTTRSRIPLFRDNRDHIVAVLDRMDALLALAGGMRESKLCDPQLSFEPYFVPESMPADELLVTLQRRTEPLAVVVGEYGELVGVVTLEDVLEELVGEIVDEEDLGSEDDILVVNGAEVIVLGKAEVKALNIVLGVELENHRSVAGLLLEEFEHIPQNGAVLDTGGVRFEVLEANDRAILRVRVTRLMPTDDGADEE